MFDAGSCDAVSLTDTRQLLIEPPRSLADDELLRRLGVLVSMSTRLEAVLVAHVAEVDARRLYLREACSSMFVYCVERLHLSEGAAYLRITAARASREHPMLLAMLADGRMHLSGIERLVPHLTAENRDSLLAQAVHKSKRQIEGLLASIAPRADSPDVVRRISAAPGRKTITSEPAQVSPAVPPVAASTPLAAPADPLLPDELELRPAGLEHSPLRFKIEPTGPSRYRVHFTATDELRDKLERLRDALRTIVPTGDLAAVIEIAVSEKLQRVEARRLGAACRRVPKGQRPKAREPEGGEPEGQVPQGQVPQGHASEGHASEGQASGSRVPGSPANERGLPEAGSLSTHAGARVRRNSSRHIPAAVRRAVWERDGGRCRFVDTEGHRCSARRRLEFHHRHPFGCGGGHAVENLRLLCRGHNAYLARLDFGEARVQGRRASQSASAASRCSDDPKGADPVTPEMEKDVAAFFEKAAGAS